MKIPLNTWPFFVAACGALLSGCQGQQAVLNSSGLQSDRIERLWWLFFWIISAVFVVVIATLAGVLHRSGGSADLTTVLPKDDSPAERRTTVVVASAIGVTVVLLFIMLISSSVTGHTLATLRSKNPVSIQVIGHQWWWEVRYENSQADQTVITANEIHIPVGQPVVIKTASHDVIHSFWVPNLHGKRDLIPGYESAFWLQADREGVYRGQCAEFCGHQHAHMAFFVIAESPDKFSEWLKEQRISPPPPSDPEAIAGKEVFMSHSCVMCHRVRGTVANATLGPDLTHLRSRQTIAAGTLPNNRGNLAGWILNSQTIKPGNHMPPNPLRAEELTPLLAYLDTLK